MRTITLLIILTLLSWQNPMGLSGVICEEQMLALFRFALPVAALLFLLDLFNFAARLLERRARREVADYEWLENWVERHISNDHPS
ncbi:MAG: hypothetical protein HOL04_04480 [Gammaproteobacteria bacterium]|jgi:hypothetical protein|nr:hypothetical protein [Gammaproteobacteria bacterium]MBT4607221.1 hypothetical protein [Thiotrichales bacterium]MBT3473282.1 hypothetical protein [Gammaproteobacteria bacterium]MBT3968247.1 hypothetical protein [Gammaproteobacteria bacterium]MBT4080816.1 hypothetical protein [Gammaproteobacteria bacterium]